jgi:hypothetical protein
VSQQRLWAPDTCCAKLVLDRLVRWWRKHKSENTTLNEAEFLDGIVRLYTYNEFQGTK